MASSRLNTLKTVRMCPLKQNDALLNHIIKKKISILSAAEFKRLMESASVVEEKDTLISDYIRILNMNNSVLVQEISIKNEIIIRQLPSIESARKFIQERLEAYNKMWDGCGCKIDYFR